MWNFTLQKQSICRSKEPIKQLQITGKGFIKIKFAESIFFSNTLHRFNSILLKKFTITKEISIAMVLISHCKKLHNRIERYFKTNAGIHDGCI